MFDVHGNVWEWVQDSWSPTYYAQFEHQAAVNPLAIIATAPQRLVRGGGWTSAASRCRSSSRHSDLLTKKYYAVGFRLALPVDAVRQALKVTGPALPEAVATTPSAPANDPIDFAAERKAAERVLALGGWVTLESERGEPVGLVDGKLPDVPFAMAAVGLINLPNVTDADLDVLSGCQRIRRLDLRSTAVDGSALANISHLNTLTELWLGSTKLTDAGLANVAPLKQLQILDMGFTNSVTDAGLLHVQDLVQLRTLTLPPNVTDEGLKVLSRLTELREFWSGGQEVTDAGVAPIIAQNPRACTEFCVSGWEARR